MKKRLVMVVMAVLSMGLNAADFPAKDIQGIIQWGAGGSTDIVMRSITPHAAEELGAKINLANKAGDVGVVATQFVYGHENDGHTLLMGAENPMLYKVMGLDSIDYSNFIPINIVARGIPVIVANNDAPFDDFRELVIYSQVNPDKVKIGSTGPGGLPSVIMAMLGTNNEVPGIKVNYEGDGPAMAALKSGDIDVMPVVLGAALDDIKAKKVKVLALIDVKKHEALPDIDPINKEYPVYTKYLPWGPFFGVFVKLGTPFKTVKTLQDAYVIAARNREHRALMKERGFQAMNIAGLESAEFLKKWQSVTSWLVWDAGMAKVSPATLGIPRIID